MLPARGMVLTRGNAAFVLTTDADGESDGVVRLQVARLGGGPQGVGRDGGGYQYPCGGGGRGGGGYPCGRGGRGGGRLLAAAATARALGAAGCWVQALGAAGCWVRAHQRQYQVRTAARSCAHELSAVSKRL